LKIKVAVGMSGGVDSSVAAYLLQQQGYEVIGVFMQNWEEDEFCTAKQDALDAIIVADRLGIDIEIVNFAAIYKQEVFANFLVEIAAGLTPNPDVFCNEKIKFHTLLDYVLNALDAKYLATGHYAAITMSDAGILLNKAIDSNKDQSYFLYRLQANQLKHVLFPLANLTKPEVRAFAAQLQLHNAHKKDSTGICFIGKRKFTDFLQQFLPVNPGEMISDTGKIMGKHIGLAYYTIGQRAGLNIGGDGEPWFVAGKNITSNELLVVQGHHHQLLYGTTVMLTNLSFVNNNWPPEGRYQAKIRYRMTDAVCTLEHIADAIQLSFTQPQWAITAGQSAVLYDGSVCLGGGIIT
jgi:tRNA-uridine 2-sulfurtransferase